jgi:hypothetical protein
MTLPELERTRNFFGLLMLKASDVDIILGVRASHKMELIKSIL